jgi:hypothetical protein
LSQIEVWTGTFPACLHVCGIIELVYTESLYDYKPITFSLRFICFLTEIRMTFGGGRACKEELTNFGARLKS